MILVFWMLSFKPDFSLSSFSLIKRLFSSFSLSAIRVVSSAFLKLLIFLPAILSPAYDWKIQPSILHYVLCISVQFSRSVVSSSLRPHGPQHAKLPCPSPTPGVYPNSWPLSRWCHLTISSSVVPFSSCPQSFPTSGSNESAFCIRWPKFWSFSFNISPSNEYSGLISFRMDWLDPVSYTHLTLPTSHITCRSRWSPYH